MRKCAVNVLQHLLVFLHIVLNKIIILTTNSVDIHRVQAGNKLVLCKLFSQIIQSLLYIFNHAKLVLEGLLGTVRPGCTPSGLTVGLCP